MKLYKSILLLLALILVSPAVVHSQFLNKLKRAAEDGVQRAVEDRVSKEIETAARKQTDKYMSQIFGPPSEYEGTDYDYGKIMQSVNMNVDTEESYSFKGYTDMLMTGTNEKGKEIDPTAFRSFLSENTEFWAMQMESDDKDVEKTIMIFDNVNEATILLMEDKKGEKTSMAYGIDWNGMMESAVGEEMDSLAQAMNISKTGNTKTILGYVCDEYITENEEFKSNYWVSTEPIDGYASYWSKNNFMFSQQMKKKYKDYFDKLPDGNVLEMTYISKEDKGTTTMKITEINTTEENTFVMDDYINILENKESVE